MNRLYVEAWRSGCKGCTVYRDGSRAGVLISTKKDKNKEEEECHCKPPQVVEVRPKVLEADVVRFQNNKEKWVAFVGLLDGRPYEIFTGLQDDEEGIVLPKSVTSGRIIKNYDVREVQQRILELRKTDLRCIALAYADRTGHQTCRLTPVGQRKHQYLEEWCRTRPEKICTGRN